MAKKQLDKKDWKVASQINGSAKKILRTQQEIDYYRTPALIRIYRLTNYVDTEVKKVPVKLVEPKEAKAAGGK